MTSSEPAAGAEPPTQQGESRDEPEDIRRKSFRVCNIPLSWDSNKLESFLQSECDGLIARVASIEVDFYKPTSKTATISFDHVPQAFPIEVLGKGFSVPLPEQHRQRSSASLRFDLDFLGVTTLFCPLEENHYVDIVAISGLGGHAFGSFKEKGGKHMWLRDALPYDLVSDDNREFARIMTFGYESTLSEKDNFQTLEDLALDFLEAMRNLVVVADPRPVVFIAHSLGGLIVKQAMVMLSKSTSTEDRRLLMLIRGLVFFGVPHEGMDITTLLPMVSDGLNLPLVSSVNHINSQLLTTLREQFDTVQAGLSPFKTFCFYEMKSSPTAIKMMTTSDMS